MSKGKDTTMNKRQAKALAAVSKGHHPVVQIEQPGVAVATNGKTLLVTRERVASNPGHPDIPWDRLRLDRASVLEASRQMSSKAEYSIEMADCQAPAARNCTSVVGLVESDRELPDWRQAFPDVGRDEAVVSVALKELKSILAALIDADPDAESVEMRIPTDGQTAIELRTPNATALIMPLLGERPDTPRCF